MMYDISAVKEKVRNSDEKYWINPSEIHGVSYAKVRELNKNRDWQSDYETDDEIIVDYLNGFLLKNEKFFSSYENKMIVFEGILFLIVNFGSSYAVHNLCPYMHKIGKREVLDFLPKVIETYNNSSEFIKSILREFILDVSHWGETWGQSSVSEFGKFLSDEENAFLKRLFASMNPI